MRGGTQYPIFNAIGEFCFGQTVDRDRAYTRMLAPRPGLSSFLSLSLIVYFPRLKTPRDYFLDVWDFLKISQSIMFCLGAPKISFTARGPFCRMIPHRPFRTSPPFGLSHSIRHGSLRIGETGSKSIVSDSFKDSMKFILSEFLVSTSSGKRQKTTQIRSWG